MLIVDSSVWIDYFCGHPAPATDLLDSLVGRGNVALGDLILAEVLQGFRVQRDYNQARRWLLKFPVVSMGGTDNALLAADYYRYLRRRGITTRGLIDCMIAAATVSGDHVLLHNDRDFDHFERHFGLRVLHP